MSDTTKSVDDELRDLLFELKDAVWCSRGDNAIQNTAAQQRATKAEQAITQLFAKQLEEAEIRVARNAMAIALDWLENDGRGKHLVQDMWDVRDISALDHIEQRSIDEAIGHFPTTLTQDTKGDTDDTSN